MTNHDTVNLALGIAGALAAASCSPPSSAIHHKDDMTQPFLAINQLGR
jgi:hypothetical protein